MKSRPKQVAMKCKRICAKPLQKPPRLTKHGQHTPSGNGCLATSAKDGTPCPYPRIEPGVPYCKKCIKTGDPSLKAVKHPKFGKTLIATRDLPKPYYAAWWGKLVPKRKLPTPKHEWALQTTKGMIDATPFPGSQLKWCSCPGRSELPTIDFSSNYDMLLRKAPRTCLLFATLRDIPKNNQVTMMYNMDEKTTDEFFAERKLVRGDVGCDKYPACRKSPTHPYFQIAAYKESLKAAESASSRG